MTDEKTKTVVYNGPFDEVEVPTPDGRVFVAKRGEPVEVPEELAKSLLEQDIWDARKAPAKKEG